VIYNCHPTIIQGENDIAPIERGKRMMAERRYQSVPLHRRWMHDIIHSGKKAHVMGSSWRINIAPLLAARGTRLPPAGWTAIWTKSLALVARRRPELRTLCLPLPWARLYIHPDIVCTVVIERTWQDAAAVFFEQVAAPDRRSLRELDEMLRRLKQQPVESVGSFRRLIRYARLPVLLRRLIWSLALNWSGSLRMRYFGSAALNPFPVGGHVTQSAMPVSFMLYFGLIEANGDADIQIFYDHRVMDGVEAYRIVRDLEATMNRDIVAELKDGRAAA
jgi:hypothetical protein